MTLPTFHKNKLATALLITGVLLILVGFFIPYLSHGRIPSIIFFWVGFFLLLYSKNFEDEGKWINWARIGLFSNIVIVLIGSLYQELLLYFFPNSGFFIFDLSLFLHRIGSPVGTILGCIFPEPSRVLPDGSVVFVYSFGRSTISSFFNSLFYMLATVLIFNWFDNRPAIFKKRAALMVVILLIGLSIKPIYMDLKNYLEYGHIDIQKDLIDGKDPGRYKYWCRFASNGWVEKEQPEFKLFIKKFGRGGTHCLVDNEIGVFTIGEIKNHDKYSFILSLFKNIHSGTLRMNADLLWRDRKLHDNPKITMDIPMHEFDTILETGLSSKNITALIQASVKVNWKPINSGSYTPKPDVKVKYIK